MDNNCVSDSSVEKGLRVVMDHKLYISQQCHLPVRRAKTIEM